jgi:hypothetical protein
MKFHRSEHGAGAVEFALIAPVLFLMLFGILELGLIVTNHYLVASASREAVRYGSAVGEVSGEPQFKHCAGIETRARSALLLPSQQSANVKITYDEGPGTSLIASCDPTNNEGVDEGDRIIVRVRTVYQPLLPIGLKSFDIESTHYRTIDGRAKP